MTRWKEFTPFPATPRGGDERGVVPTVKGRERFNMGERKLIPLGIFATLFVISTLSFQLLQASDDAIFYESFDESFEGSWIVSEELPSVFITFLACGISEVHCIHCGISFGSGSWRKISSIDYKDTDPSVLVNEHFDSPLALVIVDHVLHQCWKLQD